MNKALELFRRYQFRVVFALWLAAVIALENFLSKFKPVFGVESNRLCEIPAIQEEVDDATARFR